MILDEIHFHFKGAWPHFKVRFLETQSGMTYLSGLRKQATFRATPKLVSPRNDVGGTRAEILIWWRDTTQTLVVLLIGLCKFPSLHDLSEALPRFLYWHVINMEYLRSFLRRHFAGKPVVASWKVARFLGYFLTSSSCSFQICGHSFR